MTPDNNTTTSPEQLAQYAADEKECGSRIEYTLKKYGCVLDGQAIIRNGFTQIQVGVKKIPSEVLEQMQEAENGTVGFDAAATS